MNWWERRKWNKMRDKEIEELFVRSGTKEKLARLKEEWNGNDETRKQIDGKGTEMRDWIETVVEAALGSFGLVIMLLIYVLPGVLAVWLIFKVLGGWNW